jgi:hypothetical protein
VLGSDTFVPFMRLPTAQRREIIEDLLDIEIFGVMAALNKDDITSVREKLETCARRSATCSRNSFAWRRQFTEHIEDQRLKKLETIAADIASLTSTIDGLEREHVDWSPV